MLVHNRDVIIVIAHELMAHCDIANYNISSCMHMHVAIASHACMATYSYIYT